MFYWFSITCILGLLLIIAGPPIKKGKNTRRVYQARMHKVFHMRPVRLRCRTMRPFL